MQKLKRPIESPFEGGRFFIKIPWGMCLTLLLVTACSNSADVETARQRLLDMSREVDAMNQAVAQGNAEAAQQHQAEATRLLRAARYLYESGGAERSNDPRVLAGFADVLRQTGDFDLAARMYRNATHQIDDDATLWLNLGKSLAALDESGYSEAKAALEKCAELATDNALKAEALFELATVYRRMGLYDFAGEYLQQSLELRPEADNVRVFLAAHWARRGDVLSASAELDRLTARTPETASLVRDIMGTALADFESYRHKFADSAPTHLAYAKLLISVGRNDEAVPALERSLELDGSNFVVWNYLGSVSREVGNSKRAREAFERSLALNPDQPRTTQALQELAVPADTPEIRFQDQVTPAPVP